jgi:hypothetical protein
MRKSVVDLRAPDRWPVLTVAIVSGALQATRSDQAVELRRWGRAMFSSIEQSPRCYAPVGGVVYPAVLVPAFIGELSFALWLACKGVNVQQWAR